MADKYTLEHKTGKKISTGEVNPLGAVLKKDGVNFALYSEYAKEVFLLLFESTESKPTDIINLNREAVNVWSIFVHGLRSGQYYGYKVEGEYDPSRGLRFNGAKLLLDPYAKAITGKCRNKDNLLLSYDGNSSRKDAAIDARDNAVLMPKSIVVDDSFDWKEDKKPAIPFERLFIYEAHVKGFTAHPSSKVTHPGTYLGFIEKIPYLKNLGVNAVELLPVQEFHVRDGLISKGLTEYWGYNTIGFFAPESSYCSQKSPGCQVDEFKTLVREMHKAGLEVIIDVVYNHTGEGNELGPTLCFKGIDNPTYYSLMGSSGEPYRSYRNDTGCGNTFNIEHPQVLRLVLDSLRYWADVMHVDGFRFDMASILARVKGRFSKRSLFFEAISKDPVLSKVKLIAEPWDISAYEIGNFPLHWSEWNAKFRDTVRRFVKGDQRQIQDLARRLTGSADLYGDDERSPYNSINCVTCHDGFTLRDLFSYNNKHNEANGEANRDGMNENCSWHCGVEGETGDPDVIELRKQLIKNSLCCLFFSLGTPMLLSGDECMRTQKGNNNAYCQDNEVTWMNWDLVKQYTDMYEFAQKAISFRKRYTILQRKKFLSGKDTDADMVPDILWYGENLSAPQWGSAEEKLLCYQLDGSEVPSKLGDYHLFFMLNSDIRARTVELPKHDTKRWIRVVDTSLKNGDDFLAQGEEKTIDPPDRYVVNPRSVVVLLEK